MTDTVKKETSPQERTSKRSQKETILSAFESTIRFFLSRDMPVYLNEFGILFSKQSNVERSYVWGERLVVRREKSRVIHFEKCSNLSQFHRSTYQGLLETKDLSDRISAHLPIQIALQLPDKELRNTLEGIISDLKKDVVLNGFSNKLRSLGAFYALHNRQGTSLDDWFAGADIFLKSSHEEALSAGPCAVYERPTLESAWELFQAAYGEPLTTLTIDVAAELSQLGYDTSDIPSDGSSIRTAVFQAPHRDGATLVYCTDGLRNLGLQSKNSKGFGIEFVFHLPIQKPLNPQNSEHFKGSLNSTLVEHPDGIPTWPARPLVMGWILMQSARSRTVKPGVTHTEGVSIVNGFDTDLRHIITSPFQGAKEEHLSKEGPFYFVNIAGVTDEEVQVAEQHGNKNLMALLERRNLLHYTKPTRSSVTQRSCFQIRKTARPKAHILRDPRLEIPPVQQQSMSA